MGGGNFDMTQREQDKAAGKLDRKIAKEKRQAELNGAKSKRDLLREHSVEEQLKKHTPWELQSFTQRYPTFYAFEQALVEHSKYNIDGILREMRDYCGFNSYPQAAYDHIKGLYAKELPPVQAWEEIKEILHW